MTKLCVYCGDNEGTEKIANPNLDMGSEINWDSKDSWWEVCKDCKEVIRLQQMGSIGIDVADKLHDIAKRTGKPILSACIFKRKDGGYENTSVEFTGGKNGN